MKINKTIWIVLKSLLIASIFFLPIYLFILNAYQTDVLNHLEYELKLEKSLHRNGSDDYSHIANAKHFTLKNDLHSFFNNKNFLLLKKSFSQELRNEILLELSLHNDFSKSLRVHGKCYIITFLLSPDQIHYHITIVHSKNLDDLYKIQTTLITILYISSIMIFLLFYTILSSHKKLLLQKKKLSSSLKESRLYFNNAMIGFLIVDKNRNIINVNPILCSIFGYEEAELLSKSAKILHVSQESYEEWGKMIFATARESSVINIRYKMKKKSGEHIWVEISGAPFEKNKMLNDGGVVWTAMDITTQITNEQTIKTLNNTLNKQLSYLRLFLDTAPIPIYVNNKDGLIIECNTAFTKIIKSQKKDVLQKRISDFLPKYLATIHQKKDEELLYKDSIHYKEILSISTHYSDIYEFYKTTIKDENQYNGYICVMVDVTEHEEQENKLQRMVWNEVQKNKDLAQAHEEERLNDAKFKAIGQLSAGITHEINTPLTYIKGNLEMLLMDLETLPNDFKLKSQILDDTKEMQNGLQRIAMIVESMREMSQQKKDYIKETNLYSTLVTSLIMANNRSKHICNIYLNDELFSMEMQKEAYSFMINIQAQRVEQVWIVILNNALDELQNIKTFNEREIRINCYEKDEKIVVEFSDNAGGINEEILENIFEPFVSNKPEGGIGVGLSIAKRIIDDQGATIRAYNRNRSAVFEIIFTKL